MVLLAYTRYQISTNLGIPDFRSKDTGFYAKMRDAGFANPEDVFDLLVFDDDPRYGQPLVSWITSVNLNKYLL